jgi:peptidyl-prolyl cis-trans isomerase SurA
LKFGRHIVAAAVERPGRGAARAAQARQERAKPKVMKNAIVVAALLALVALPLRAEIIEQIIVKVNGEILTKTELEDRQVQALRQLNRGARVDLQDDAELRQALEKVTPQVIVEAVDEILIAQLGKERNWRLGDTQFNEIVQRIRTENKLETDESFQAALQQEGMTLDDLRRSLERQMFMQRVQGEAVGRIQVTEEEARDHYRVHRKEFATPATLSLREILVEAPASTGAGNQPMLNVAAEEEAQASIEALRARVTTGGEDFAKVAAEVSAAPSRANGGLIGPLNLSDLEESLRARFEVMKPGEVTEPIRTTRGYQIFKLETFEPSSVLPFEQARDEIANRVYQQKVAREMRKYVTKLREQAIIEWKSEDLRKMYEQQVAAQMVGGTAS